MTTFDEAARKAADEMGYLYELSSEEEVARIITKHYADLAETFGLLCELAVAIYDIREFDINLSNGKRHLLDWDAMKLNMHKRDNILASPRIAALLAEKG